jgi:hypothetical protein
LPSTRPSKYSSLVRYRLEELNRPNRIVLTGDAFLTRALDTITLSPAPLDPKAPQSPQTEVHYKLELQFKGVLRPFVGMIQKDLDQLGREAMVGLTHTCAELFGEASKVADSKL